MVVIQLAKPISGVKILTGFSGGSATATPDAVGELMPSGNESVKVGVAQQHLYQEACRTLEEITGRLNQFCREIFSSHHEAIARLSVEIARKVLRRNVSDGDYEIEAIIKEALKNAPQSTHTVVRLNPQDLTTLQKLQESGQEIFSGVELAADPAIGRAEYVVENPKGIIKVLIDEHLEHISKALIKTG